MYSIFFGIFPLELETGTFPRLVQDRMNLQALAELEFTFFFPSDQAFIDLAQEVGLITEKQFSSEDGL